MVSWVGSSSPGRQWTGLGAGVNQLRGFALALSSGPEKIVAGSPALRIGNCLEQFFLVRGHAGQRRLYSAGGAGRSYVLRFV